MWGATSNFKRSVLGCIEADFCDQILVGMKDPSALKMERKKGTMTRQKENMEENEKIDHLKKEKSE